MASRQYPSDTQFGRRTANPERASTGGTYGPSSLASYDRYTPRDRQDYYTSPRSSTERVVPVSTETYRNGSLVSSNRPISSYDSYGDPRRGAYPPSSATVRSGPAVTHQSTDRSNSIITKPADRNDRSSYYVTPSSSNGRNEHKKTYSVEDTRRPRLPEERDNDYDREHHRREPPYPLNGPSRKKVDADDYGAYEYASPREVFENTEPRRSVRRRGSVDAATRRRPSNLMENYAPVGPPPALKGIEKLRNGEGVARRNSLKDSERSPPRQKDRGSYDSYSEDDDYQVAPRTRHTRPESAVYAIEPRYSPPRYSPPRFGEGRSFEDTDLVNRGFGIRAAHADPPHSRDASIDSRSRYTNGPIPAGEYPPEPRRDERKWEPETKYNERYSDYERDHDRNFARDREVEGPRRRESTYDEDKNAAPASEDPRPRDYQRVPEGEVERYPQDENRPRGKRDDGTSDTSRQESARDRRRYDGDNSYFAPLAAAGAATGAVAYAASRSTDQKPEDDERSLSTKSRESSEPKDGKVKEPEIHNEQMPESPDETYPRERHYVAKDDKREAQPKEDASSAAALDPDEEFRMRVLQEAKRVRQARSATSAAPEQSAQRHEAPQPHRDDGNREADDDSSDEGDSRALVVRPPSELPNVSNGPMTDEPAAVVENRENRVRIVEPPKEAPKPKGILRKPTDKFPEYKDEVREGVSLHKDDVREGVSADSRWTKISRELVNPQALREAQERFEERQDFVIVLRVMAREEIQELADRTEKIRAEREHRYRERERDRDRDRDREREHDRERDRRHHRRHDEHKDG